MNFLEYSPLALRTAKPFEKKKQRLHALLGLLTELGELADAVKRHVVYGKPLDKVNIVEEVADCMWYCNLYMVECQVSTGVVDRAWAAVSKEPGETAKAYAVDPFALVEDVLFINSLISALNLNPVKRHASDEELIYAATFMLCEFLDFAGYTLSQCLESNINKLAARYGDKYSDYMALNRNTDAERVILEGANVQPK